MIETKLDNLSNQILRDIERVSKELEVIDRRLTGGAYYERTYKDPPTSKRLPFDSSSLPKKGGGSTR